MPLPALPEHLSSGDVQGGEQRRSAVADVVVGAAFGIAEAHRKRRLRAIERLVEVTIRCSGRRSERKFLMRRIFPFLLLPFSEDRRKRLPVRDHGGSPLI